VTGLAQLLAVLDYGLMEHVHHPLVLRPMFKEETRANITAIIHAKELVYIYIGTELVPSVSFHSELTMKMELFDAIIHAHLLNPSLEMVLVSTHAQLPM